MEIRLQVDDAAVADMLSRAPDQIQRALKAGMTDATILLKRDMQEYPPQRPGSAYRRTNTLKRSWSRQVSGSGTTIRGVVGSNQSIAPYNRVVQDASVQAAVHQGRWQTVQSVAGQRERQIQDFFRSRLQQEIGR